MISLPVITRILQKYHEKQKEKSKIKIIWILSYESSLVNSNQTQSTAKNMDASL